MANITQVAKKRGYGVVGPCPFSPEQVKWCFESARKLKSPLIICSHASLKISMPVEVAGEAVKFYAKMFDDVPVALCLDHGDSYEDATRGIRAGFTGVMIDKSMCPDEENIRVVKEVVRMAHSMNIAVEGAIGGVPWRDATFDEVEAYLTKIDPFKKFVEETGVDAVAVAVGSFHGDNKKGDSIMHYDLIAQLKEASPAALVMHGCSGSGDNGIINSAKAGITKFNVGGELVEGAMNGLINFIDEDKEKSIHEVNYLINSMKTGYASKLERFMTMVGSTNKY